MDKFIVIDGKKYKLVPVEGEPEDIVDSYTGKTEHWNIKPSIPQSESAQVEGKEIAEAIPKVSEYRERFKNKQIRISDIKAKENYDIPLRKSDSDLDKFDYKGDKLFFGEGINVDY